MEDNSSSQSQNHNGPLSGGANVTVTNNKQQNSDNVSSEGAKDQGPQYSMPGILHFIQHEWARFELDRSQWELDRAEFQVFFIPFSPTLAPNPLPIFLSRSLSLFFPRNPSFWV